MTPDPSVISLEWHGDALVVIATGAESVNPLAEDLADTVPEMHIIGDAKEPRKALEAIKEGFLAGLKI